MAGRVNRVDFDVGAPDELWRPCCAAFPMGFIRGPAVAQTINEHRAAQGLGMEPQPPMADRGPATLKPVSAPARDVYVDNLGVLSTDHDRGAAGFSGACRSFEEARVAMHDRVERASAMGGLGVELDARRQETLVTAARYWRLDAGLRWLLARGRVSAHMVEVFVGHCASVGLLVR